MSQYASATTEICCSGIYCNKCKWLNSFLSLLSGRIQFILTAREPFSMHAHPKQISLQNLINLLLWSFTRCKWLFTLLKVHLWPLHNPLKSYKIVWDFFDRSQANICLRYDRSCFDWAINMQMDLEGYTNSSLVWRLDLSSMTGFCWWEIGCRTAR